MQINRLQQCSVASTCWALRVGMEEVREGFMEEETSKLRLKPLGREVGKPLEGVGDRGG